MPSPGGPPARREHRFLCKESGGKESPEGGYPPLDSPKAHPGFHSAAAVFPQPGVANSGLSTYPESVVPCCSGRPPKRPSAGGEWRGEREVPLSAFSFPGFFSRKEIGRCPRRTPVRRAHNWVVFFISLISPPRGPFFPPKTSRPRPGCFLQFPGAVGMIGEKERAISAPFLKLMLEISPAPGAV